MMDQIDASSKPGLVTEMLKRHLESGSKPKVKLKVKMELPRKKGMKHSNDCTCSDCTGGGAANQWSS